MAAINNAGIRVEDCQHENISMKLNILLVGSTALLCSTLQTPHAQIVAIGPFSGTISETWESFPLSVPWAYGGAPQTIMGGAATVDASPPWWFGVRMTGDDYLGTSGYVQPADGMKYAYIQSFVSPWTITFQTPVREFGAYWGTYTHTVDGRTLHVTFLDELGGTIGAAEFLYSRPGDGLLDWHGWRSPVGAKSIIVYSELQVMVDGLQANVPEPAATGLLAGLGLAAFGLCRRVRS